ncbi:MAG: AAA family ATPase [Acidobacteria bacterium]|nr:AAA family ATPase [Acidobacteriota bacterium]
MTVFVGPSNTGKSWLATVAYALHRHFATGLRRWRFRIPMGSEGPDLPKGVDKDLVHVAEGLTASASGTANRAAQGIALTPAVEEAIRWYLGRHGGALGKEIERCFGVDAGSHLVRREGAGRARILLRHELEGVSSPAVHELNYGDESWTFQSTIPDGWRIPRGSSGVFRAPLLLSGTQSEGERTVWIMDVIGALADIVLPSRHPAFYLPADRTGLMNAHSTVVSALIQSATMAGIRQADPLPLLSGVRGDFLEQLVEMASKRQRRLRHGRERLRRIGKRIEDGILGGAVKVSGLPGLAYPHFTYHPGGWKAGLPLANASSMVSELAPVVLYLRHVVVPNDLLIIDEPESHLHPAMQVAFTQQIAEMARAGVRVIVTTHSEWVLEALGNVVGRAEQTGRPNRESGPVLLDARDIGVWLFETANGVGSSTVKEIALDPDTGLYPSGFDAVATALHNEWTEVAEARGDGE